MAEDQQERQTDLWSAYLAEGISSTSLSDRDQEIRELRRQVQDLTRVLETFSLTQRQISEHETRADWYSSVIRATYSMRLDAPLKPTTFSFHSSVFETSRPFSMSNLALPLDSFCTNLE